MPELQPFRESFLVNKRCDTLFTGHLVFPLRIVDSTNNYLNSLIATQRVPEGTVIVAEEQEAGRGRAGEKWISEPGKNLLMSCIFYPSFLSPNNLFMLSKTFSLGIYDGVKGLLKDQVKIKWPNDIYVGD